MSKRIQCPCCNNYPFANFDEAFFEICPICFWQYDEVAHDKPDYMRGANKVTLNEARENYQKFGVCEGRFIGNDYTREPLEIELAENNE